MDAGPGRHRVHHVDSASELNKRKVRLFVEAVWNEGRLELIDELVADNYFGRVPGIDEAAFQEQAEAAKAGCPVSRALAAVPEITLSATLES